MAIPSQSEASELSPVKRALIEIRSLRAKLQEVQNSGHEPLAVIGMALRFPGATDPDSYWRLLTEGRSAITEIPRNRWDIDRYYDPDPSAPGKMYVRKAGFLDRVDEFDAGFFGIHASEAVTMDPQQRLMLEVAWEALENAAQSPAEWNDSPTGVFLGIANSDYQRLLMADPGRIDAYTGTGGSMSIAAGRLSYLLGLQGPSLVIDTSCSSSLVALHLAGRSLRSRECRMALVGGVNLILSPESTIALCKSRMLAPDGVCKTFDESANGFVRGEGCGVVVLKRLADALQDGDHVHAIIRGSAVNQDGRSGGLTVPSRHAQETVIREALADAQIDPAEITYVEAHGTGTSLGDPIEVHALISALCAERPADRPLYLGSVKTNIGHLEAASGIAGFIKTVLSLQQNCIPAHLHLAKLNPHIDLRGAPIRIATESTPWVADGHRRVAGVSSFGFSGTNAHVIVEEAPASEPQLRETDPLGVLLLSARSPQALVEMASRYASWFEAHPQLSLSDVCFTAATGRKKFECRASWQATSLGELRQKLEEFTSSGTCDVPPADLQMAVADGKRIPLPSYPFERRRYWFEEPREARWSLSTQAGREQSFRMPKDLALASYETKWKHLRLLTTASIVEALHELGASLHPGERQTAESLLAQTAIIPIYGRLLARWINHLVEQGRCVSEPDGSFVPLDIPASAGREELVSQAAGDFQQDGAILEYVASCGRQLAAILIGKQSPLETLFPNGDPSLAERLYERSPLSLYFNSIAGAVVAAAGSVRSKPCRILEVGAGTGATTSSVLPLLPSGQVEYHFTDLSHTFLNRAKRKFEGYPFVRYGLLDVERDPIGQGYGAESFDVVVATNVLHATADLRVTLAHIRSLMTPGGVLVLCEATEYFPWFDVTTALIEGWQRFDDGIRKEHPLLDEKQWKSVLRAAGFADVQTFPEEGAAAAILGQHVFVARASSDSNVVAKAQAVAPTQARGGFRTKLKLNEAPPADRLGLLAEFVREQLAEVLGVDSPGGLSPKQKLMDLGLDSLMALQFRDVLERGLDLGGSLSSTLAFDFPTIDAVAAYLERQVFGTECAPVARGNVEQVVNRSEPLAIIGAGCRLPGGADDLDSFWTLLANGTDAIDKIPGDRWNIADWYDPDPDTPGKMTTREGGFIKNVDQFDPEFFGISPREAESMDPQQRLLLEVSWEALENAGQNPSRLGQTRTGVFVGLTSDDYSRLLSRGGDLTYLDTYFASGVARSVAAGRISYVLGLQGPNISIDTACSSSLVAVHQACQSLRSGECRMALAGGANVILLPDTSVALSRARMMAPDGRCKAFDDSAEGFVRGEGCVMLVLKRLSTAIEDRDPILAVIRGSAVNQDGRTSGLTVPNGPAQEAVIRLALTDAGIPPSAVDYVEAHGTGTSLGDPIEVHALVAALGEGRNSDIPLRIGSVKTNIGHLESAAGAAGLLKAALALSHGEIPPNLHFRRWNQNIDLKGCPVTVPIAPSPWKAGARSRIAGVSSFGFSGTNAHIILEEAPPTTPVQPENGAQVLKLSARSETALSLLAQRYCAYFENHPEVSLADVCDTAESCRVTFDWRLEITAASVPEVCSRLAVAAETRKFAYEPGGSTGSDVMPHRKVALPLTPFERKRYWRPDSQRNDQSQHPLLGRRIVSPAFSQTVFESSIRKWPRFLAEHRVRGKAVLPMAAYVEIFLAATGAPALEDVFVREPLDLDGGDTVQVVVGAESVELFQLEGDSWKLRGSARIAGAAQQPPPLDLIELRARVGRDVNRDAQYGFLHAHGIDLGPTFQLVHGLRAGFHQALGRIELPHEWNLYRAHPALIDAWIQVLSAALSVSPDLYLPVGIERFELFDRPSGKLWSSVSVSASDGDTLTADILVADENGLVVAKFQSLRLRRAGRQRNDNFLYEVTWRGKEQALETAPAAIGTWVIFTDDGRVGADVAARLQRGGAICRLVKRGESFGDLLDRSSLSGVLYLRALDANPDDQLDGATFASVEREICGGLLQVVRRLAARGDQAASRLLLVTRGAQLVAADDKNVSLLQAPLWGLARTIGLEYPELRCTSVDLDPTSGDPAENLLREVREPDGELQIAWRGNRRTVARLTRIQGNCNRLEIATRGSLDELKLNSLARRAPGPGEVEIRVASAGLNFRDVLNALGEYPGDPGPLGAECSGHVVEVGSGVTGIAPGDEVIAIAKGALSTYVTVAGELVGRKPSGLSMEEAAAIPVAYVTARYALHHVGRLQAGDRVLIHAAAGGVGLAAVMEAQRVGAEVFATAGTEEKRAYLRSLGITHVMDSRTSDYSEEILKLTLGRGVDVVLNSLGGQFVGDNLRVLAPSGRYLELGKKGIWDAARVSRERPDVSYFVIDWGQEYERRPRVIAELYQQLMRDAESGLVRSLPCRSFSLTNAVAAFRWMAQARHTGKIVLNAQTVRANATYLITGGLGGLGRRVAEWLIERGARHLVLIGRSAPARDCQEIVRSMRERGVRITVCSADVSRREELSAIFAQISKEGPSLRGLVHAAGLLDNAVMEQLDWEKFETVLAPKVDGSWYLHELSKDLDLDFFVMFSSLASLVGAPGQANHGAANSFMDALAHYRRIRQLPAVSINWGPWSDIGAASGTKASRHLAGRGVAFLTPEEGLQVFETALTAGRAQYAAARVDWPEAQKALRLDPAFLSEIAGMAPRPVAEPGPVNEIRTLLMRSDPARRRAALLDEVRRRACRVLGLEAERSIDPEMPLSNLGLDSLMAIELRNSLSSAVGKSLPSTMIFSFPSTGAIADYLANQVLEEKPAEADTAEVAVPDDDDFLSRLEQLSDDEVDRLLNQATEQIS
jgi:acyl transferase domain-containing protein/NAD(P)-dependent dehydrogenase (short-subunit alcohol dehydrogenase family)/acyl carrier protein/SAM-dependent methyltransferase